MWNIFKKKVNTVKDNYTRECLVRLQHKIPRIGSVILKIGDKYFRCKELG